MNMKTNFFGLLFLCSFSLSGQSFSSLQINLITEGANVYIDNVQVTGVNLQNFLTVTSGTHTITATKAGYSAFKISVSLSNGEQKSVSVSLRKDNQSSIKAEDVKQVRSVDQSQVKSKNEDVYDGNGPTNVFVVVEEMPTFPGGDQELMRFIHANLHYPAFAKENNVQGRVILRFCVTYKGGVNQVQILKGIDPALDDEAIRVIKMLPLWKPGKQGGKPVNVWYSVPVTFQIK